MLYANIVLVVLSGVSAQTSHSKGGKSYIITKFG